MARTASIPHGTTINAQGTWKTFAGAPTIPAVDITPTFVANGASFRFKNQDVTNAKTRRIPRDLAPFIAAGTITQAIVSDPNTVLRNAIAGAHPAGGVVDDPRAARLIDQRPHPRPTSGRSPPHSRLALTRVAHSGSCRDG